MIDLASVCCNDFELFVGVEDSLAVVVREERPGKKGRVFRLEPEQADLLALILGWAVEKLKQQS